MQKLTQLAEGVWRIDEFMPISLWEDVRTQILAISNEEYKNRQEPMRYRLEINQSQTNFYQYLVSVAQSLLWMQ